MRLEWFDRTGMASETIPATKLYHQRPGWKIAVDLHPAPTSPGTSTVVWPTKTTPKHPATDTTFSVARKVVVAGQTLKIVAEARDAHGNRRGTGEHHRFEQEMTTSFGGESYSECIFCW